jgi:hypothetical protein
MPPTREPIVVVVTSMLALGAALSGVVLISLETSYASPATIPGCPGPARLVVTPAKLSPVAPILLPRCDGYALSAGPIFFSVDRPAHLVGSWAATAELAFIVINASYVGQPFYGWPPFGSESGTINVSLTPGSYAIEFEVGEHPLGDYPEWVATEPIEAEFPS